MRLACLSSAEFNVASIIEHVGNTTTTHSNVSSQGDAFATALRRALTPRCAHMLLIYAIFCYITLRYAPRKMPPR